MDSSIHPGSEEFQYINSWKCHKLKIGALIIYNFVCDKRCDSTVVRSIVFPYVFVAHTAFEAIIVGGFFRFLFLWKPSQCQHYVIHLCDTNTIAIRCIWVKLALLSPDSRTSIWAL